MNSKIVAMLTEKGAVDHNNEFLKANPTYPTA